MRILLLTQWFAPEPIFKGLPFARELARRGHEVEVLTGFPNYPDGKIYSGYRVKPWQSEVMEGIPLKRVALYPTHDNSGLRRILGYLSFALSSLVLGPWLVRKPDVVYVYNLVTLAWTATLLRRLYGCRIVLDVQDLWPESVTSSGMLRNRLALQVLESWCRWAYRSADRIVVLSPGLKLTLLQRGIPAEKIEVIYNWCDEIQVPGTVHDDMPTRDSGLYGRFNILFAGTMGKAQALDAVLDAAKLVAGRRPEVQFVFIGGGIEVERLKGRVAAESIGNCLFLPRRPVAEMGPVLNQADVLLVHLRDNPLFRMTIPSKTQAYLAAGRPILMAMEGDAAEMVRNAGAGLCCPPEAPEKIADAVLAFHDMPPTELERMGAAGRSYYERKLAITAGVGRFEEVFREAARK
jgi:glycosyltransferase involved in cell wall biosynthesis